MYIKRWFQRKVEAPRGFFFTESLDKDFAVQKETEKAVMIIVGTCSCDGEYDSAQCVWIPKSCIASVEERQTDLEADRQRDEARQQRYADGCAKYEKLISFCKENKVKGARVGLRTATLMALIEKAGLAYAG